MIHELKILNRFANEIINGDKTFEVRKNDRSYQKGDFIRFKVIDDYGNKRDGRRYVKHPLHDKLYKITYILSGWGIENGYVILAIKPKEKAGGLDER